MLFDRLPHLRDSPGHDADDEDENPLRHAVQDGQLLPQPVRQARHLDYTLRLDKDGFVLVLC